MPAHRVPRSTSLPSPVVRSTGTQPEQTPPTHARLPTVLGPRRNSVSDAGRGRYRSTGSPAPADDGDDTAAVVPRDILCGIAPRFPYVPLSRPAPDSPAGQRMAALRRLDEQVRSDSELLSRPVPIGQGADAGESERTKARRLWALREKHLDRMDDAYLTKLVDRFALCRGLLGAAATKADRDQIAFLYAAATGELVQCCERLDPALEQLAPRDGGHPST